MSMFPHDPYGYLEFACWNNVFNPSNPDSIAAKQQRERDELLKPKPIDPYSLYDDEDEDED